MLGAVRMSWRQQRFELIALIGGSLLLAAAGFVVAWQLNVARDELEACYRSLSESGAGGFPCAAIDARTMQLDTIGTILTGVATASPFVVGLFLGAPLVAREIERRTAPIAWSLSVSRGRWLAWRVLPVALGMLATLLLVGLASEALIEALIEASPAERPGLQHFGTHGPLIAARGVAVLALGLLVGLAMGRELPAILMTGLVTAALMLGLQVVRDRMMEADATWIDVLEEGDAVTMVYEQGYRVEETGELLTFDAAYARFPEVFGPEGSGIPPGTRLMFRATPAELYPAFVAREIGALGALAVLVGAVSLVAVARRRPG